MNLKAGNLTEIQAKEISDWKYDGDYSIYNLPPWEQMIQEKYSLSDATKRDRYIGFVNEYIELVGFVKLLDKGDSVFFGIGVNPKVCGIGIGKVITKMALIESQNRFPNKPVVLEVRTWNKRAVSCYKSQGFKVVTTKEQETKLGFGEFYVMEYNHQRGDLCE
jgi:ribosomal-protein-alanine N-acetyltransferase